MNDDKAAVVMLFFTLRVFLVGAIVLSFPRISRKGLMFGTYLGEDQVEGPARRELLRSWDRGSALVLVVALVAGWSIGLSTGRWVAGNLIGTAILLVPFVPLYFWMHGKASRLALPDTARQARRSAAPLEVDKARGEGFAFLALIATLVASLSQVGYAVVGFQSMPDRIPSLATLWGFGETITDKSLVSVVLIPSFNLVFAPFFAVMALLIARAKRSVRSGSGGRSTQAQARFRVAYSHLFAGIALSLCLFLGITSLEMIKVWQSRAESLGGIAIGGTSLVVILYMGVSLFRVMWLGQGGARLEAGSADAPLTGALADNARWILGLWYVDRSDPAVMVEARWGIGYTMNLGSRTAQVLLIVFGIALLTLMVLVLVEAGVLA